MASTTFVKTLKSTLLPDAIFLNRASRRIKVLFYYLSLITLIALLPLLTASGQQPASSLTPSLAHIDFDSAQAGNTMGRTETLTNTGSAVIIISGASATGTGFSLEGLLLPLTLIPGKSTSFKVKFSPTSFGKTDGKITVVSNDSATNLVINLSGTVKLGNLVPDPPSIGFGTLQVGTERSPTDTLTNDGGTSVTLSAATLTGSGFSQSGLSLPLKVNPGESVSFEVILKPTSVGSTSGALTISSDGLNPALKIPLLGTGVDIKGLPECSLAKTNNDCKLTIDRQTPLTPPTIQMYSNQKLTIIVASPKTYERYFSGLPVWAGHAHT